MGLRFYTDLFREMKQLYPQIKLHALGPPEIAHIAKLDGLTHTQVLVKLKEAGLDSLPGAGAEILNDRVRRLISKGKCGGQEWLDRSEEHTSELQSLMRISYAVFCLKKKKRTKTRQQ